MLLCNVYSVKEDSQNQGDIFQNKNNFKWFPSFEICIAVFKGSSYLKIREDCKFKAQFGSIFSFLDKKYCWGKNRKLSYLHLSSSPFLVNLARYSAIYLVQCPTKPSWIIRRHFISFNLKYWQETRFLCM